MKPILQTKKLSKHFKQENVLNNITFSLNTGEIYALIGRNGAGKTTLMKIISGLIQQSNGEVLLNDIDYTKVGILIENPALFEEFTAYDNLKMKCICANIDSINDEIEMLLELVGLSDVGNKKVKNFSLGMKQRLGIALALVGRPTLLVLDEPINGLDPQGIVEIREILKKLSQRGITIIISSHILDELYKVCTYFGIIEKGELVYQATKNELTILCEEEKLTLEEFYLQLTGGKSYV